MASIITEESGKLAIFEYEQCPGGYPCVPESQGSPYIMNPTEKKFEPRVGFAWDPIQRRQDLDRGASDCLTCSLPVEMERRR